MSTRKTVFDKKALGLALATFLANAISKGKKAIADWLSRKESRLSLNQRKWIFIGLFGTLGCYCGYLLVMGISGAGPAIPALGIREPDPPRVVLPPYGNRNDTLGMPRKNLSSNDH